MQDIVLDKRSGQFVGNRFNKYIRGILLAVILGLLVGLDFVLYARSGLVSFGSELNGPVLSVLISIIAAVFVFVAVLSVLPGLQKLVFSVLCAVLFGCFMDQFLQIDKSQYLGIWLNPIVGEEVSAMLGGYSNWIISGLVFIGAYIFAEKMSKTNLMYFAGILLFVNIGVFAYEMMSGIPAEPLKDVYISTEKGFLDKDKKVVFFFMPNLTSYTGIGKNSGKDTDKTNQLSGVELGFFYKHGFKVYPNAYIINDNKDINIVEFMNILDSKNFDEHLLNNAELEKLWKFKSAQRTDVFLKDNQLSDVFRKAGYKISAYQNQRVDICKKNNQYAVDRCNSRYSMPIDINYLGLSESERADILRYQWLSSLSVADNGVVLKIVRSALDRRVEKQMSLPYDRLYVVNSSKVLQKLLDDLTADKGAGVYFVYFDLLDQMMVYDEWCHLKPLNRWNALDAKRGSASFVQNNSSYNEQVLCFWGQMDEFMRHLEKINKKGDLTVIIQGLSGKNEYSGEVNFKDRFERQNLVMTAIRSGNAKFGVNNKICNSKDILRSYLFKAKPCKEFSGLKISMGTQEALYNMANMHKIKKSKLSKAMKLYNEWIEQWKEKHKIPLLKLKKIKAQEEPKAEQDALLTDEAVKALMGDSKATTENHAETTLDDTKVKETVEVKDTEAEQDKTDTEVEQKDSVEVTDDSVSESSADVSVPATAVEPAAAEEQSANDNTVTEDEVGVEDTDVAAPEKQAETNTVMLSADNTQHATAADSAEIEDNSSQSQANTSVAVDALIDETEDEWALDPAKALGVSGDEQPAEKIIIKVK